MAVHCSLFPLVCYSSLLCTYLIMKLSFYLRCILIVMEGVWGGGGGGGVMMNVKRINKCEDLLI